MLFAGIVVVTLRPVVIDIESYYDPTRKDHRGIPYSLSHQTTESYIRHPWFECHGAAIKWSRDHPARWYDERQLRWVLQNEDWSNTLMICHHGQWDHGALAYHYNVHPKMLGCTLAMSRMWLGNHIGVSLDSVRKEFGLPPKTTPYNLFVGKHWSEMDQRTQQLVGEGACDEAESIWRLFGILLQRGFPKSELETIDVLLRMFVEPQLIGDIEFFARVWESESTKKQELFTELGITESDVQSSDRFAELLKAEGVEIEYKQGKNELIPQFAKNDQFMKDLLESDDSRVANLAAARLGAKSTITQTRAETLGWMSRNGLLMVYIRPYGAKTTRPAGGDSSNFLNMKKADPDMPKVEQITIKQGICAPEGFLLAPIDSSQIECRLLNFVAGQDDVVEKFRNGEDPYVRIASQFYGYEVNKKDHPTERQVGKVIELQAGYMSGGEKIRATLRNKAGIIITPEEGIRARDAYRQTHPAVVNLWGEAGRIIARLAGGAPIQWGPVHIRDSRMWLPNGACCNYDSIEYYRDDETGESYWRVRTRKGWEKIYSGKLVENLIQALAWVHVSGAMVRIHRMGYRILNAPYDELLVLIPKDGHEEKHAERCAAEMKVAPDWLPNLPLDAEWTLGERYSK